MGNTWTVYAWDQGGQGWDYRMVHRGESALRAILAAVKAKRAGAGCVKVEWR